MRGGDQPTRANEMGEVEMSRNNPMQRAGARCSAPAEGGKNFAEQPYGRRADEGRRQNLKINPMQSRRGSAREGFGQNLKINPMQCHRGRPREEFGKSWKITPCSPTQCANWRIPAIIHGQSLGASARGGARGGAMQNLKINPMQSHRGSPREGFAKS
jgi:hypothetical protein